MAEDYKRDLFVIALPMFLFLILKMYIVYIVYTGQKQNFPELYRFKT